ncbi:MAG: hypothetical protein PHY15_01530 [Eubacteriales bacterium]|nr:hypothetical protein [Eubacteriales bacterium]
MEAKNKFEHLMSEKNYEEIKKEGKTIITQYSKSWNRDMPVATVSHYVTLKVPYATAKSILSDMAYCYKRDIIKKNYDATTKTIELTGRYPFSKCKGILNAGENVELIGEYYTYGV